MSTLIALALGIAIGAAIPDTVRALWKKAHAKGRESLGIKE